jgi:hypothetical protein
MNLTGLSDFIQVLHIERRHSTKNDYFSKYIQFTIIYLLQKQRLRQQLF